MSRLNSVRRGVVDAMISFLLVFSAICMVLAVVSLMASQMARKRLGVPRRFKRVGKPDFIVRTIGGIIPFESKSTRAPAKGPYESQIAQLAAYCVLLEDQTGVAPAYGLIKYSDRTLKVTYTDDLRNRLGPLAERPSKPFIVIIGYQLDALGVV